MKLNSASSAKVGLRPRIKYGLNLIRLNVTIARRGMSFDGLRTNLEEYRSIALTCCGKPLEECRILEIGHGQRPFRLLMLLALSIDARGVDLDQVTWQARDVLASARHNGWFRATKSLVRKLFVDRRVYDTFRRFLNTMDAELRWDANRILRADVASESFWQANPGPYDFILSEDVFEHIPPDSLAATARHMAQHMATNGVALIRPMVFTGICGGHQIDWYTDTLNEVGEHRQCPPWDHLLENRFVADTYLNRWTRRQYAALFGSHFSIEKDEPVRQDLGREFLTAQVRQQLKAYDDYELFSNQVTFLLRKPR